jgi:DNA polymerase
MKLHIDIETRSRNNIKKGTYKYAEAAELLLFGYAWDDGPVEVIDCMLDPKAFDKIDDILYDAYLQDAECWAHNAQFERVLLSKFFFIATQLPWYCTKIKAYAHSLPGGLDKLSEIYGLPIDKAKGKEGKKLIQLFCVPDKKTGKYNAPKDHPKQWAEFIAYNKLDVEAERAIDKLMPTWNCSTQEWEYWFMDQKINDRGFAVDIDLATSAENMVLEEKNIKDARTAEITDGAVSAATQRDKLLEYILNIHGVTLPDLTISTLTRRLEDPDLPDEVKELIALRLNASGTTTKKYRTLLDCVSEDGRLRGTLQFLGANRTGRWSGRIFQPHNLARPKFKNAVIEEGIAAIKGNYADLIYDDVKAIAASAIRGAIVAGPGKKLCVADLSSIEGRGLAWLAGEQWKIDAYAAYDADKENNFDMYVLTYARSFNVAPETVTKKQRQLGKVLELALGYGGGVGAVVTFSLAYNIDLEQLAEDVWPTLPDHIINQATDFYTYSKKKGKTYDLSEKVFVACDSLKRLWRLANPMITQYWSDLEDAVKTAITTGSVEQVGACTIDKKGSWLRIKLPSGRYLSYAGIRLDGRSIKYLGVSHYSHQWGYQSTYGGKLAENITQAMCRDILANGMEAAEGSGYDVVLSVHDELLTETPDTPLFSSKKLSRIMSLNLNWSVGMPLNAAGFEAYRYKKED